MKTLSATLIFALSAAGPAAAQPSPAARIGALLHDAPAFEGAALPALESIPAPETPAAALAAPAAADSVVPAGLWSSLGAPDAATISSLTGRIPGLAAGSVHEVPVAAAEEMFDAAIAHGQTPLDFFTDPAFRGPRIYYFSKATVAALFARYDVRVLTPASGTTTDGKPFVMQALVIGAGRIDALYDHGPFKYDNPLFDNAEYTLDARVTEKIQGPGDFTIEGVSVKHGWFHPIIQRIVKTGPLEGRVETNLGNRTKESHLILRR
jgi:hypothetical protein